LWDAVDQLRIEEARKLKPENLDLLKGAGYIWLKNPWNFTESIF
jgi:hypothetical protein